LDSDSAKRILRRRLGNHAGGGAAGAPGARTQPADTELLWRHRSDRHAERRKPAQWPDQYDDIELWRDHADHPAFQIAPRLSGAFRYSAIQDWNSGGFATYYDRGFDLRLRAIDEGQWASWVPAVTIGLQDFAGTGLYSGEYIVATKHLTDQLKITAGLGWGRLGSSGAFGNTGTRPPIDIGEGGNPNTSQWFRGPVAPFGGIEWQPTDRLTLKAEYSSDAYTLESDERGVFDRNSSFNFGATYESPTALRSAPIRCMAASSASSPS
jgi:hypothetical protein